MAEGHACVHHAMGLGSCDEVAPALRFGWDAQGLRHLIWRTKDQDKMQVVPGALADCSPSRADRPC